MIENEIDGVDSQETRIAELHQEIGVCKRRATILCGMLAGAGEDALAGRDPSLRDEWVEWQELLGRLAGLEMALDRLVSDSE